MSPGDWCLMVPDMLWSHHHRVEMSKKTTDILTLEDETTRLS